MAETEQMHVHITSVIAEILRTELKVPADTTIDADTTLMGGDYSFDSLDVLMLVTAVEKRFGMKIPNASIQPEVFQTVGSLADFIDLQLRADGAPE